MVENVNYSRDSTLVSCNQKEKLFFFSGSELHSGEAERIHSSSTNHRHIISNSKGVCKKIWEWTVGWGHNWCSRWSCFENGTGEIGKRGLLLQRLAGICEILLYSFGFFLVFKYAGNSQFTVVIFDVSGAEIYYPCKTNFEKQNSASERRRKRSSSFDHNGYNTRSKKHKLEDQEEIIDVDDDNVLSHGKSGNKDRSGQEIESSRNHEKEKARSRQRRCSKMKNTLRRKQSAIGSALNFKPENPSFTALIRRRNLTPFFWMCRLYFGEIIWENLVL